MGRACPPNPLFVTMAEAQTTRSWGGRVGFALLAAAILLAQLLPLSTQPPQWAPPDWLLLITLVWVIRRPDLAPVSLIAVIFFISDILLMRPPGLLSALVVFASEILRRRSANLRALSFPVEWIAATSAIVGLTLAYRVILFMMVLPRPPVMLTFSQTATTVIAYPLVVLAAYLLFGISRPAQGEVDILGKRI